MLSFLYKQVVLNRPMSEVARRIVSHVRLALLSAEELEKAERDNKKDNLIPVSYICSTENKSCYFLLISFPLCVYARA